MTHFSLIEEVKLHVCSEEVRQKTSAKVNTELTSTLLLTVCTRNSAFAATVIDNIAQPLAAGAEII